jgi:hypothetical protein
MSGTAASTKMPARRLRFLRAIACALCSGVVDRIPLEPVLVARSTNVPHGAMRDRGGKLPRFPGDARTETNDTAENAKDESARGRSAPGARMAAD